MNNEKILYYLGILENGALNYYQTVETIRIASQSIQDYIEQLEQQCKHQKEVIDKTINAIDLVIELIKQQPTEDDRWILDRLNGFKIILEDKEVSE